MMELRRHKKSGFTLMELMVAVSLLTILILAVGRIFRDASKAVSLSQASTELFSNVRAVHEQIESDVKGMDRGGFLVIRSAWANPAVTTGPDARRIDQVVFIANGNFPNRTGTNSALNPQADNTEAASALVWYGQGIVEADGPTKNETVNVKIDAAPSGVSDQEFVLCRRAILLMPANGTIPAYASPGLTNNTPAPAVPEGGAPVISSSRVAVASITPAQLMQAVIQAYGGSRTKASRLEADDFCFRSQVLPNPQSTQIVSGGVTNLLNGYFRMHPILQQGCASFAVEWTDGTTFASGDVGVNGVTLSDVGLLRWYGLPGVTINKVTRKYNVSSDSTEPDSAQNDGYTAIFSFDNRSKWPTALKFTYRVLDTNGRLQGGREFAQVVNLRR